MIDTITGGKWRAKLVVPGKAKVGLVGRLGRRLAGQTAETYTAGAEV